MKIIPVPYINSHKQGTLFRLTVEDINQRLGFKPNVSDDLDKVLYSWAFLAGDNNIPCAIWDWKGSANFNQFSFFGPRQVFDKLFPGH